MEMIFTITGAIVWAIVLFITLDVLFRPLVYAISFVYAQLYALYKNKKLKVKHFMLTPKQLMKTYIRNFKEGVPTKITSDTLRWKGIFDWEVLYPVEQVNDDKQW